MSTIETNVDIIQANICKYHVNLISFLSHRKGTLIAALYDKENIIQHIKAWPFLRSKEIKKRKIKSIGIAKYV